MAVGLWSLLTGLISPLTQIVKGWQKKKQIKLENECRLATAVTEAKIQRAQTQQEADIKWENTALQNAGIKDDIMMFVILTPMVMCFIPGGADIVREGFNAMNESLPEYWEYAFYATIGVSYGIRKITDFMGIKKGA